MSVYLQREHTCKFFLHKLLVTEFARKTGDLNGLSSTDVRLIALAYTLEKEHVGTDHLRNEPTKQVLGGGGFTEVFR